MDSMAKTNAQQEPSSPDVGVAGDTTSVAAASAAPERRAAPRQSPHGPIGVQKVMPVLPLSDVQVLNVSSQGVALRTRVPVLPDERLSFTTSPGTPPILAKVVACEPLDDGGFRVRCECLLGEFELF